MNPLRILPNTIILRLAALVAILCIGVAANAQGASQPYAWEAGNFALLIPAGWGAPVTSAQADAPELTLRDDASAPTLEHSITLTILLHAGPDTELGQLASDALAAQETPANEALAETVIAGGFGPGAAGLSADGQLYGLSYAIRLGDGRVLVIAGQAAAADQALLASVVAGLGLTPDATSEPFIPGYRSAWTAASDGGEAIAAMTASADTIYAVGANGTLTLIDPETGAITETLSRDALAGATDISLTGDTLYAAVPECACLRVFGTDGEPHGSIGGFANGAPQYVAASGLWLYATDIDANGYRVRAWYNGTEVPSIPLADWLYEQPLLSIDNNERLAAISRVGDVLAFMGRQWVRLASPTDNLASIHDAAFLTDELLTLATANGVEIRDTTGTLLTTIEMPSSAVAAQLSNEAIFTADDTGSIHALGYQDAPDRIGAETLLAGGMVTGRLDALTTDQRWTYEGTEGERVTISATEANHAGELDVAIRLVAPDGTVEAENDDHGGTELFGLLDAQIERHPLQTTGTYTVVIERIGGDGLYRLGVTVPKEVELNVEGATEMSGWLGDAVPTQRWRFEVEDAALMTVTMQATSGDLDPTLRLIAPNGDVLATNDDAADPAFGRDAQLVRVELPGGGTYTLEAGRFDGAGEYTIVIVGNA